ncbi:MAG TPA: ferredoxin [Acidimicrobiales bacterium]
MKVEVDSELCQGHARCWEICPEVFQLDDEGYAYVEVADVPPEHEAKARQAVINCPERAITAT